MFFGRKSPFERMIDEGIARQSFKETPKEFGDHKITNAGDARAIVKALIAMGDWPVEAQRESLHQLCVWMQQVGSKQARTVLYERAMPALVDRFTALRKLETKKSGDLVFAVKIMAMYDYAPAAPAIIEAVRERYDPNNYLWSVAFGTMGRRRELRVLMCKAFAGELPQDFCAVALLDMANGMWNNDLEHLNGLRHPFDSPQGWQRLEQYLTDSDPDNFSYARSATAALPFIASPKREQLLSLAMDHSSTDIQIESAWASAKLGSESGIKMLARFCTDWNTAVIAATYLHELGRTDAIPAQMHDPDFAATAQMVSWLAHPNEFGSPPDEIEMIDSREMYWPPSGERRQLWLFKYLYRAGNGRKTDETGIGMTGGLTSWSFWSAIKPDWPIDDIYALHCSWEACLDSSAVSDRPEKYNLEHGRKLLNSYGLE
jgi:hypothetical protein